MSQRPAEDWTPVPTLLLMKFPVVPRVTPLVPETEPEAPMVRSPPFAEMDTVGPEAAPETVTPAPELTVRAPEPVFATEAPRLEAPPERRVTPPTPATAPEVDRALPAVTVTVELPVMELTLAAPPVAVTASAPCEVMFPLTVTLCEADTVAAPEVPEFRLARVRDPLVARTVADRPTTCARLTVPPLVMDSVPDPARVFVTVAPRVMPVLA